MTNIETLQGHDISRFLIPDIDQKSITEVARLVREKSQAIRSGNDKETEDTKRLVGQIPGFFLHWFLNIIDFIVYELNYDLPQLGFSKKLRGSAILSATGSLGLEVTYVPLSHFSRCPLVFTVGKVRKMPIVVNDQLVISRVATITFTYDHRYIDGAHSADIQNLFQDMFDNPEGYTDVFEEVSTFH